jgi:hypothetical protein
MAHMLKQEILQRLVGIHQRVRLEEARGALPVSLKGSGGLVLFFQGRKRGGHVAHEIYSHHDW